MAGYPVAGYWLLPDFRISGIWLFETRISGIRQIHRISGIRPFRRIIRPDIWLFYTIIQVPFLASKMRDRTKNDRMGKSWILFKIIKYPALIIRQNGRIPDIRISGKSQYPTQPYCLYNRVIRVIKVIREKNYFWKIDYK